MGSVPTESESDSVPSEYDKGSLPIMLCRRPDLLWDAKNDVLKILHNADAGPGQLYRYHRRNDECHQNLRVWVQAVTVTSVDSKGSGDKN